MPSIQELPGAPGIFVTTNEGKPTVVWFQDSGVSDEEGGFVLRQLSRVYGGRWRFIDCGFTAELTAFCGVERVRE